MILCLQEGPKAQAWSCSSSTSRVWAEGRLAEQNTSQALPGQHYSGEQSNNNQHEMNGAVTGYELALKHLLHMLLLKYWWCGVQLRLRLVLLCSFRCWVDEAFSQAGVLVGADAGELLLLEHLISAAGVSGSCMGAWHVQML